MAAPRYATRLRSEAAVNAIGAGASVDRSPGPNAGESLAAPERFSRNRGPRDVAYHSTRNGARRCLEPTGPIGLPKFRWTLGNLLRFASIPDTSELQFSLTPERPDQGWAPLNGPKSVASTGLEVAELGDAAVGDLVVLEMAPDVGVRILFVRRVAAVSVQPRDFMDLREVRSSRRRESPVGVALELDQSVTRVCAAAPQRKRYSSHEKYAIPP